MEHYSIKTFVFFFFRYINQSKLCHIISCGTLFNQNLVLLCLWNIIQSKLCRIISCGTLFKKKNVSYYFLWNIIQSKLCRIISCGTLFNKKCVLLIPVEYYSIKILSYYFLWNIIQSKLCRIISCGTLFNKKMSLTISCGTLFNQNFDIIYDHILLHDWTKNINILQYQKCVHSLHAFIWFFIWLQCFNIVQFVNNT